MKNSMKSTNDNYNKLVVLLEDEKYRYHLYEVVSLFFKNENLVFEDSKNDTNSDVLYLRVSLRDENGICYGNLKLENYDGVIEERFFDTKDSGFLFQSDLLNLSRKVLKREIYILLSKFTGKYFPWGCFTGIRPAKIINKMLDNGMGKEQIIHNLESNLLISHSKANLAYEVAIAQQRIRKSRHPKSISIYIGIPFCPTRCLYCSFTSNPMGRYESMAEDYIDALIHEMTTVSKRVVDEGLNIESIYIGGGTPTALNKERLLRLLTSVRNIWFNINDLPIKEFSVEAGRPDSIDDEKLAILKEMGVTRISINPQTMNDDTLRRIGRRHSASDFDRAFNLARRMSFDNINTDIIAGLPGENFEMFSRTLEKISEYSPENLTIHAMSIKRASELRQKLNQFDLENEAYEVEKMVDLGYKVAKKLNMNPYYMYRQKNMLGNLENTSYSLPGYESYYNIHIMEEDQTILAFGSGSSSKFVTPRGDDYYIERIFNVKGVEEYISRVDEMIARKIMHPYLI